MDFSQYQRLAMRTKGDYRDDQDQLHAALTGLVGELGEVAEIIKKHLWHGRDLNVDELRAEIGDTMWYQALLCDALGLDMQAVAEDNIERTEKIAEALVTLYRWHNTRDHMGRHLDPPAISEQMLGRLRAAGYTARSGSGARFASRHRVTRRGAAVAQCWIRAQGSTP